MVAYFDAESPEQRRRKYGVAGAGVNESLDRIVITAKAVADLQK